MRFLIDRCAGTRVADWLRTQGHDVVESRDLGPDPGDRAMLVWAVQGSRILITIGHGLWTIGFLERKSHNGLIRLPDVSSSERVTIVKDLIARFQNELEARAIITVRGGKIRISAVPE